MSEIKRHYVYEDSGTMAKGCYINEKDHLSTIQQAKIEAVREYLDLINKKWGDELDMRRFELLAEQIKEQGK